jgi:hypothetical protein
MEMVKKYRTRHSDDQITNRVAHQHFQRVASMEKPIYASRTDWLILVL